MAGLKRGLGINVHDAAAERIAWAFDTFPKIYVSFSGGKDSTIMLHMVMDEAIRRGRKVGLLFVDLEAQYTATIEHIQALYDLYAAHIEPYWLALPIVLRNAVSQYDPRWIAWNPDDRERWVRKPPSIAITDPSELSFYRHAMEFEELVDEFGHWYGDGELTCCMVGIRADESINRWRTLVAEKRRFDGRDWTTWKSRAVWNAYPIYDWRTRDIWVYHAKTGKPHNRLYDLMHKAGLTIHQMRICQPYGDDQRKGLWLYQVIEPETWGRVVSRVNGANSGALYAREYGNVMGNGKVSLPPGHTWRSFAAMLLQSMPARSREHYENKIAVFLKWYESRGYEDGIPDAADPKEEAAKRTPSWRRVCKTLLRNDWWCKGLSFSQHNSEGYEKWLKIMRRRREKWTAVG